MLLPGGIIAQLAERCADISDRDVVGHAIWKIVRANFHTVRAGIPRQIDELFPNFDLPMPLLCVRRVELASGPEAHQMYFGALKALPHACAFRLAKRGFHSMPMSRAQLHTVKASGFEHLDDCLEIVTLQDVVRYGAEMEGRSYIGRHRLRCRAPSQTCRRRACEKISTIHVS